MLIEKYRIQESNEQFAKEHKRKLEFVASSVNDVESILQKLIDFQIAIPSWALGAGGTRFGRFSIGGEPRNLEEKIEDVGLLHALNQSSGAISLHIPWDIPENHSSIKALAAQHGLRLMLSIQIHSRIKKIKNRVTNLVHFSMLIKQYVSRPSTIILK